jgi:hypothetical protein
MKRDRHGMPKAMDFDFKQFYRLIVAMSGLYALPL